MRRRIRFTGRKQIPLSAVDVKLFESSSSDKNIVALSFQNSSFKSFPESARIKLRLRENNFLETLEFGTVGSPKLTEYMSNTWYSAPTCQIRIVSSDSNNRGLLLGSTNTWTLKHDSDGNSHNRKGILLFRPLNIAPRAWKLEINEHDHPVVYIDTKILNPKSWATRDPVFVSCVLPAIISEIFLEILDSDEPPEQEWETDWLDWADSLMPSSKPPFEEERQSKKEWIGNLVDSFCKKHKSLELLIEHTKE